MRISVISAAVCCALFSAHQRQRRRLERGATGWRSWKRASISLNSRPARPAAEQRAAAAEQQVQALSQQTTAREQKQQATNQQLSEQLAKRAPDDGFTFNAYARSGMLVNSHGKGARGGPGVSRPVRSTAMPMSVVSVTKKIITLS